MDEEELIYRKDNTNDGRFEMARAAYDYELRPYQAEMLDAMSDSETGYIPYDKWRTENIPTKAFRKDKRHNRIQVNPEGFPTISDAAIFLNITPDELIRLRDKSGMPKRLYYQGFLRACRFDVSGISEWMEGKLLCQRK